MSFTGYFTSFASLKDNQRAPYVTDIDGFEQFRNEGNLGDLAKVSEKVDRSSYPYETRLKLHGFSWYEDLDESPEYDAKYSVPNFGLYYDYESFENTFKRVVEFAEPFQFYHAKGEYWPKLSRSDAWDIQTDSDFGSVYHVVVEPEELKVDEYTLTTGPPMEVELER